MVDTAIKEDIAVILIVMAIIMVVLAIHIIGMTLIHIIGITVIPIFSIIMAIPIILGIPITIQ